MLIRFILLSVYFLERGQPDKISSWAVLLMSCSAYQWNIQKLAGTAHINANHNFIGIFFLFIRVKVSMALQLLSAGIQRQRGAGGKPEREAETSLGRASPAQHCWKGPLSSAFPVSVFLGTLLLFGSSEPLPGPLSWAALPQDSWLLPNHFAHSPYFIQTPFPKGKALKEKL